ncbi:MAG: hypothetical protein V4618_13445 [Pseudomonadota bacterium]
MANNKPAKERSADQMMAAINRYRAENPNGFQTIEARPFGEGIRTIARWLRSDEQ